LVANFNPATGALEASPKTIYEADRNNFGPRIGLSWQPLGNVVLRAGYGIFYDTLAVGDSLFLLGLNPPFVHFDVKNNGPVLPQFNLTTAFQEGSTSAQPSIFPRRNICRIHTSSGGTLPWKCVAGDAP
jgi:hypothetical protein